MTKGNLSEAYDENKGLGTSQVLEGSSVARAIIHMMESRDTWSGHRNYSVIRLTKRRRLG